METVTTDTILLIILIWEAVHVCICRHRLVERCIEYADLRNLRKNLDSKQLSLEVTDAAKDIIVKEGYDPVYGARPLRRAIQSAVEDLAAERILDGSIKKGDTVTVVVKDGKVDIERSTK